MDGDIINNRKQYCSFGSTSSKAPRKKTKKKITYVSPLVLYISWNLVTPSPAFSRRITELVPLRQVCCNTSCCFPHEPCYHNNHIGLRNKYVGVCIFPQIYYLLNNRLPQRNLSNLEGDFGNNSI